MEKIIQQGAEAVIILEDDKIRKERIVKSYRISELDFKLRKLRTRSEGKIIDKLGKVINVPKIINVDDSEMRIDMEFIKGEKLSEKLESLDWRKICKSIGETTAKLHDANIIHGDLTTSNMIYVEEKLAEDFMNCSADNDLVIDIINKKITSEKPSKRSLRSRDSKKPGEQSEPEGKVYFIDFGLSFHSKKIEDKAVDLHLLKQAFEAKHFKIAEQAIKIILENYNSSQKKETIEKLKTVESRGRYKERH